MKQSEALTTVNQLINVVQKIRSDERETLHALSQAEAFQLSFESETRVVENMLEDLAKWVNGPYSILPGLLKVSERGSVEPQEFYNFMYIVHHLQHDIAVVGELFGVTFPEPDAQIMRGWEDE